MVADLTFEDKLLQLEEWIKKHQNLPEKIGKMIAKSLFMKPEFVKDSSFKS